MELSITYHERPGVYSDYTASKISASAEGVKTVALVGVSTAEAGLYTVTSRADAEQVFGKNTTLGKMLRAAYENGAGKVQVYSLKEENEEAYKAAFSAVLSYKEASFCAVDSEEEAVQQALRDAITAASVQKGECVGIVGMANPEKTALLARAAALDCERMVLVGPDVYASGEDTACGGFVAAAALCGILAAQEDPALPLNGAVLSGFDGVTDAYEETDIDALVQGGVTVLEAVAGKVSVLRGITTRQTVGEGRDTTYRELTTVLVIDDVIPGIRNTLGARFPRVKNSAATRSAIRSQVMVELESRLQREIIDAYDEVSVKASDTDPTTCLVTFGFTVTHGLNRIYLTAHISV